METSQYLGLSTVVGVTEPNITETTTLDNFGDTSDIAWTKGGSGLVNVAYGFDAVGDVLWRDDVAADNAGTSNLEQTYSYDTMHRLTGYAQGTFTAGTQSISSANTTVSASWSLDSQGNRYDAAGTYGTSYTGADESSGSSYSAAREHDHGHLRRQPLGTRHLRCLGPRRGNVLHS